MTDISQLVSDLQLDEGWVGYLYDDANDAKIVPGTTVKGHPSTGWGFALDVAPFTQSELIPVLESRAADANETLQKAEPWIAGLSEARQRALGSMAYNLGVTGLLKFTTFMYFMQQGQYESAAEDLESTLWFKQVSARAQRIQTLIRNG